MKKQTKVLTAEDQAKEIKDRTGLTMQEIEQVRQMFNRIDQKQTGVISNREVDDLFKGTDTGPIFETCSCINDSKCRRECMRR